MNKFDIEGKIERINDTLTFPSGFQKREFVIETLGEHPQLIKMELVKDRCSILDNFRVGQNVVAHFNLRGNEHNGKVYTNLVAWKVEHPH